jgi:hypothetical protein
LVGSVLHFRKRYWRKAGFFFFWPGKWSDASDCATSSSSSNALSVDVHNIWGSNQRKPSAQNSTQHSAQIGEVQMFDFGDESPLGKHANVVFEQCVDNRESDKRGQMKILERDANGTCASANRANVRCRGEHIGEKQPTAEPVAEIGRCDWVVVQLSWTASDDKNKSCA